jgi:single-stranded-DNA-specific exonuclease
VAAKLTEQFGRPSLVVNERNGLCTASLRGPATYHLAEGLEHCADLLDRFGGHAQAAGCTFKTDRFDALVARLDAHIQSRVPVAELVPTLAVDGLITVPALTPKLIHDLSMFEPFGAGNHEPRVLIKGVTIDGARTVGENDKHLQGRIGSAKLIGFGLGQVRGHCDQPLDLVGRLGIDSWNGRETVQLMLDDARLAQA